MIMDNWLSETELEGALVKLIPLTHAHKEALVAAAADGELWQLWYTSVPSANTIDAYVDFALAEQAQQRSLPFVVVDKETQTVIGSTRYCNAEPGHRRLEIGYTWYAQRYQRTGVNTECKYLLLSYAFETLGCIAVEFRTHWHNHPSRNAISRLGAKQDGVLRNHRLESDGCIRDTVVFSIIQTEWNTVKKSLLYKMQYPG
ncbi:MAG: GNAT family N-acetyltransferase [Lewinellaceae bacterium]|nr:GNAT family N-acetyltransferase [Lewinellaceae bacterium]